jgi:hypothetical protein
MDTKDRELLQRPSTSELQMRDGVTPTIKVNRQRQAMPEKIRNTTKKMKGKMNRKVWR